MTDETKQLEKTGTCVLCGGTYERWGHNPEPVVRFEQGRACDVCNETRVIPARLSRYRAVEQVLAESEKQNDV